MMRELTLLSPPAHIHSLLSSLRPQKQILRLSCHYFAGQTRTCCAQTLQSKQTHEGNGCQAPPLQRIHLPRGRSSQFTDDCWKRWKLFQVLNTTR